ncbi:DUF1360 domain-containing protein [Microlunatus elymi]|uniref:DUF1360 domain-containing protein n=1 Tax=Microlunatus elymi TaxID=2596828 RepID=UPI001AEF587B|nr:DUF1360 domain-containing protein [Microlunatus elymi]
MAGSSNGDGDKHGAPLTGRRGWWRRVAAEYSGSADRPLGSYLGVMAAYAGFAGGLGLLARSLGRLNSPRAADIVLAGVATHKVTRLIAKDPVTSPMRAPFTRFADRSGDAELAEEARGTGLQKAIGELVSCPFCLGQWVATGFTAGYLFAPRATRVIAAIFTEMAVADFLHFGYSAAEQAQQ